MRLPHSAPERLARELPKGTVRRALARIERLRATRRPGEVFRVWVDNLGQVVVDVTEERGACARAYTPPEADRGRTDLERKGLSRGRGARIEAAGAGALSLFREVR